MRLRSQLGFSLLEAIVAMVLMSTVGVALFSWVNGNILALNRIEEANARSEATINVLEYMHPINPMRSPEGSALLGAYRISWRARPVTDVVDRRASLYQFALYDTHIDVARGDGKAWFDLKVRQVGYNKVRTTSGPN